MVAESRFWSAPRLFYLCGGLLFLLGMLWFERYQEYRMIEQQVQTKSYQNSLFTQKYQQAVVLEPQSQIDWNEAEVIDAIDIWVDAKQWQDASVSLQPSKQKVMAMTVMELRVSAKAWHAQELIVFSGLLEQKIESPLRLQGCDLQKLNGVPEMPQLQLNCLWQFLMPTHKKSTS